MPGQNMTKLPDWSRQPDVTLNFPSYMLSSVILTNPQIYSVTDETDPQLQPLFYVEKKERKESRKVFNVLNN